MYIIKGSILSLVSIGLLLSNSLSSNNSFSSSNNIPNSSTTQDSLDMSGAMDSVDTYSSGMGAAGGTPFRLSYSHGTSGGATTYIDKTDGYLYVAGDNSNGAFGIGNTSDQTSFVKVGVQTGTTGTGVTTTGFYKPIDYDIGSNSNSHGLVVDQYGKVWTAGSNASYNLGWGSSYSSSSYNYFRTVATSGTTGETYLPSNYQAVAVSGGGNAGLLSMILTSTGALYGAGGSAYLGGGSTETGTFTRLDGVGNLPAATTSNPIVDFACGYQSSYVLYKDGSLYYGTSSWKKLASNISMFDVQGNSTYCYMYNSSTGYIQTSLEGSSPSNLIKPTGTIVQLRGSSHFRTSDYSGWGYLNSAGTLYLSSSSTTTAPAVSNVTPTGTTFYQISGVSYFDLAGRGSNNCSYGIIQNGTTKLWGFNGKGNLGNGTTSEVTFASPSTVSGVDTSYMPEVSNRDISQSPPANMSLTP